jgi:hypothetical protein
MRIVRPIIPRTYVVISKTLFVIIIYYLLAEIPGIAQDSVKNKGIREINYVII